MGGPAVHAPASLPMPPPASGVHHWPAVAAPATCARWLAWAESALAAAATGPGDAAGVWPCSLPLAQLPDLFEEVQRCIAGHEALRAALDAALGPRRLLAAHCFVRHQPAPARRRGRQQPHSWHQDGALGFDFMAAGAPPYPPEALLQMQTCWLPLTPCGATAPGLAWIDPPPPGLLPPAPDDAGLDAELAALGLPAHRRSAVLAAGDLLQFDGATVHRTHATEAMAADRTSVELRWLPADAWPARLACTP